MAGVFCLSVGYTALSDAEVRRFQETGEITVEGHLLTREDIQVSA